MATINNSTSKSLVNAISAFTRVVENSTACKLDGLTAIKSHLTGLFDISMKSTKKAHCEDYVEALTKDLIEDLKKIWTEVDTLSSLTIEMVAHCNE